MSHPQFVAPDLNGRVAIVTGASRGIGKAVALALAEAGCDVCVAAKSERGRAQLPGSIHETADAIRAMGRRALAVRTDVRSEEDVAQMVAQTAAELGRIDVLFNNAGAIFWAPVTQTPSKRLDLVLDVNFKGPFYACQQVIPHMMKGGGGHIINCSPPVEPQLLPGKVAYMTSKFGMSFLAQGLAAEVRSANIAVNALWPATIIESQASINHGMGGPEHWRKPDVVSDALLALLKRDAKSCTGQILLDEDILREEGVTDFEPYNCVPGGKPMYISGPKADWSRALGS